MTAGTEQKLDRGGVTAALAAFVFWGLVPIYYKGLQDVGAWEVLAHRVIWSVPLLLFFLAVRDGRKIWKKLRLAPRNVAWLVLSGMVVSLNWLVFVWAVANDHVLDTSLGYFGTPLVNVVLGYIFLKERLNTIQVAAVAVAALGTVYLGWYLGGPPWIAMTLAISFGVYGLLRKRLPVGPMLGLLWEIALMLVPAALYLLWLSSRSNLQFLHMSTGIDLLLIGSSVVTVLPLIWFNMAAQKLPLSILGFFQYLAPSMSFLIAVFLFNEPFTPGHAVAFACIWLALVMVSIEPFQRAVRRLNG
ncbi:MAG: EamA family transporter RarD [Xanthomonadales bacterium]|nr:EamA family transporter RarD [Gammaproteobacteria bacterium]NNK03472.1 EamA family transporter RarD [Xanthomonadales bacterium]